MPRAALGALDALLGFEKVIEATWFFSERIEPASLHTSLSRLASRYPLLAGHVGRRPGRHRSPLHGWEIRGLTPGLPFGVRTEPGTSRAAASATDASRFLGVDVRSGAEVMAGRSAVMAVALTNFDGGGSAVGVRLSHAVADASGFYRIVREWSRLHNGGGGPARGGEQDGTGAPRARGEQERGRGEDGSEDGSPRLELRRDCVEAAHRAGARAQEPRGAEGALDTSSWRPTFNPYPLTLTLALALALALALTLTLASTPSPSRSPTLLRCHEGEARRSST